MNACLLLYLPMFFFRSWCLLERLPLFLCECPLLCLWRCSRYSSCLEWSSSSLELFFLGHSAAKWPVFPQLKQVFTRAYLLLKACWNLWMISASSSFPSTSSCSSVTDTREDKQKPPREGSELAPEVPTRAIDLEAEA